MKVKYLKFKNWLLVTVMGSLGLSSCHCHKELEKTEENDAKRPKVEGRSEMMLMYGVPTMDFKIRGQVNDSKGKPVRNIKVNMLEMGMEVKDGELQGDPENVRRWLEETAVTTDDEGRFNVSSSDRPREEVRLLVRDVDGKENGEFRNRLVEVKVQDEDVDRSTSAGMYHGLFHKELEIKLENK